MKLNTEHVLILGITKSEHILISGITKSKNILILGTTKSEYLLILGTTKSEYPGHLHAFLRKMWFNLIELQYVIQTWTDICRMLLWSLHPLVYTKILLMTLRSKFCERN